MQINLFRIHIIFMLFCNTIYCFSYQFIRCGTIALSFIAVFKSEPYITSKQPFRCMLQCYFLPNVICIARVRLFSLPKSFHEYFLCTWFVNCKVDFPGFWKSWEITGNKDHISSVMIWNISVNTFFGIGGVKGSKRRKIRIRNCHVNWNSCKRNFTYSRLSVLSWLKYHI